MRDAIRVIDNFCPSAARVRESALQAGVGTWQPSKGYIGSSVYEGMGFWGKHSHMLASLAMAMEGHVFPNSMFFRVTTPGMEKAYTHSDRESGAHTCVAYLSEHDEESGTAFYRHRATGLFEMPTFAEMQADPALNQLRDDMVNGGEKEWEQMDFVRGRFNRAVIFHAPLFHSRIPKGGLGVDESSGRMVWVCHFHTPFTLKQEEERHGA